MMIKILMPALSPTMKEGNLVKWFKKEGDQVEAGEVIAEIETDKALMEIEAVEEGIIAKIIVNAGTKNVKVNEVIAILAEEGEDIRKTIDDEVQQTINKYLNKKEAVEEKKVEKLGEKNREYGKEGRSNDRIFASPLVRRIASQKNIDLHAIQGSGPRGRIVKLDLELYKEQNVLVQNYSSFINQKDVEIPISNMRQVIAAKLVESKQQVPHFYLEIGCIIDKLLEFKIEINSTARLDENKRPEYKVSINDLLIKAAALSLAKHPKVNSAWYGNKIVQFGNVDISVAVAIEDGLMTPIVKTANQKSIFQISSEVKKFVIKAKTQRLKPEEYRGGSFSISNLGMYSIKSFYAIINPPQSCIMAIGNIKAVPMYNKDGELEKKHIINITLSCDHRVVDGATAAIFLNTVKEFIEKPSLMICY